VIPSIFGLRSQMLQVQALPGALSENAVVAAPRLQDFPQPFPKAVRRLSGTGESPGVVAEDVAAEANALSPVHAGRGV
jgi:hypothetical protein